jgi:hypothetical protein
MILAMIEFCDKGFLSFFNQKREERKGKNGDFVNN